MPVDESRRSIFDRLFAKASTDKFDVTEEFLPVLFNTIRMTGLTFINFEAGPFNTLAYWFPKNPQLRGVDQYLNFTVRTETGHVHDIQYRFSERDLFNPQGSFDSILQLHFPRLVEKEAFKRVLDEEFPLL